MSVSSRLKYEHPEFDELTCRRLMKKEELQHGRYYVGRCSSGSIARWNADEHYFYHWREKFGRIYIRRGRHPIDFEGLEVFRPLRELSEPKFEIPFDEQAAFSGDPESLFEYQAEVWCTCGVERYCVVHLGASKSRGTEDQ